MRGLISIFQLITEAQKGDDGAFLKLFQLHEEDIYRMAFIYVKNQEDALDVVQEVAYRSFKNKKNPPKTGVLQDVADENHDEYSHQLAEKEQQDSFSSSGIGRDDH